MPDYKDPREEDIVYGDRRLSRPDVSLPDWEVPDSSYRPIPIVWFTAALLAQFIITGFLLIILLDRSGWLAIGVTGISTGFIAAWTWQRGMKAASKGWQIATGMMLAGMFALYCFAASTTI